MEGGGAGKRIRLDARLFEELTFCFEVVGISHSQFLSWDDDDQAKALAWQREKQHVCPGCGSRLEEWLDDEGLIDPELNPYFVHAERCRGCELVEGTREAITGQEGAGKGLRVYLVPNYKRET